MAPDPYFSYSSLHFYTIHGVLSFLDPQCEKSRHHPFALSEYPFWKSRRAKSSGWQHCWGMIVAPCYDKAFSLFIAISHLWEHIRAIAASCVSITRRIIRIIRTHDVLRTYLILYNCWTLLSTHSFCFFRCVFIVVGSLTYMDDWSCCIVSHHIRQMLSLQHVNKQLTTVPLWKTKKTNSIPNVLLSPSLLSKKVTGLSPWYISDCSGMR